MIATLSKQFLNKRHCRLQSVDNAVKATMQTLFHTSQKNEQINASNRPAGYRMGWTRNVIAELLPFTSELISGRGRPLENIAVAYCVATPVMDIIDPLPGQIATQRRVEDSWMELILPFSDQSLLRDSMVTSDGSTIRFGKLFEILDSFAADVACRHCCGRKYLQIQQCFI